MRSSEQDIFAESGGDYSDAHISPAAGSLFPPRYYAPQRRERKPRSRGGKLTAIAALCLCSVLLGGLAGSVLTAARLGARLQTTETAEADVQPVLRTASAPSALSSASGEEGFAALHEEIRRQVVDITTEVTYQTLFGRPSSFTVSGTGFFLSSDGYILTTYHVIEYACLYSCRVKVTLYDETRRNAEIVGVDERSDLAVLKIPAESLSAAPLGDSGLLSVGDEVAVVGSPLGEQNFLMTFGRVNALNRLISTDKYSIPVNTFQIDAAVSPGSSGSPVYNSRGEVVGVLTTKYQSSGIEHLGFAIPINDAASIASGLISGAETSSGRVSMGLNYDKHYSSLYSQFYQLPEGVYVQSVTPNGAAAVADIHPGDIITAIDDFLVQCGNDLEQAISFFSAGEECLVTIFRDQEYLTLPITLEESADSDGT